MSLLWAVPPVAVAVAVLLVLLQLRTMTDEVTDLHRELRRLDEVREAAAVVRAESATTRTTLRGLRAR